MFRIFAVQWSIENHYVLSGSEDTNIRVWKDDPSRKIGPQGIREERKTQYRKTLQEKFKYNKEIKKLNRAHMPKYLNTARTREQIMKEAKYRKKENVEYNNPVDLDWFKKEKKKRIVGTIE